MKKLLYFFPVKTSFVAADHDILSKNYIVSSFYFKPLPKWKTPYYFLVQFIFILFKLHRAKVMFSHFSGYHSFLPALFSKLFKIPHYIVLNGTECNNFPEIHYGYLGHPLLFWFSKKSLQWSTRLFPVSKSLVSAEYAYTNTNFSSQGYMHFYKNILTPHTVIHNGISPHLFVIDPGIKKVECSFITVAAGLDHGKRRILKGLDLIVELAKLTPEYHFTFIGGKKPLDLDLPANITLMDFIPHDQLSPIYNKHQFYLQLSVSEGFGISVCEAMLCGCVPIVSNVGILPDLAGEHGYVLSEKNVEKLLSIVRRAISEYNHENTLDYRKHVMENFSMKLREEKLLEALATE